MIAFLAGRRAALRILFVWVLTAVALDLWAHVIPGVHVSGVVSALAAAAAIGLLNALVWPVMIRIALPITVLSIGAAALVFNGLIVIAAAAIVPGFAVASIWSGTALAIALALVNTLATSALAIDDDDFYYRAAVRRLIRPAAAVTSSPGVVFVQIDGLSHDVLSHALDTGHVPTMAAWLGRESHRLLRWETDWSSQTGASQAGLLHGSNVDMPAFRWWEKDRGVAMVTNHPRDAMEIERRHSDGHGLLAVDGASRANVVSGDAPHTSLTMSRVLGSASPDRLGDAYFAYFANPYNLVRTIVLAVEEIGRELWNAAADRRRGILPRVPRRFPYALIRAWTCVVQRDLQVEAVIGDMFAGRSVIYTDLLAYDEVAHHSGIERRDSLQVLRRVDRQLARLEEASKVARRAYRFVVLSDHGQTQGPTFRQRWGTSLDELVQAASNAGSMTVQRQGDESWGYLSGSLTEAASGSGLGARAVRGLTRSRRTGGIVELGPERKGNTRAQDTNPEVVVLASGCLGLIYFARRPGRLSLEQIQDAYPDLIPALRRHPGIGFLLVRSAAAGALVLGGSGTNYLDQNRIEGEDPLARFGPHAAAHVRRVDGFTHVADIMVNSAYSPENDEVFAFEELVGSHGGLGGPQSYPFVLFPSDWAEPEHEIVGAEAMHGWLQRWLNELGQRAQR